MSVQFKKDFCYIGFLNDSKIALKGSLRVLLNVVLSGTVKSPAGRHVDLTETASTRALPTCNRFIL